MEEKTRNAGQGLGVAALVLGVISFIVASIKSESGING